MRSSGLTRKTNGRKVSLSLTLDGTGKSSVATGNASLDKFLAQFAYYSKFDLYVTCESSIEQDAFSIVSSISSLLGKAFSDCISENKNINRFADFSLPVSDSLVICSLDALGDSYLSYDIDFSSYKIGDFETELFEIFFLNFVKNSGVTLHLHKLYGTNSFNLSECLIKSFARALKISVSEDLYLNEKLSAN